MTTEGEFDFNLTEATIAEIHSEIAKQNITIIQIVRYYLDRIKKFDDLNAIISTNPNAIERADELDEKWTESGFISPVHGIPVIVKDNVDTNDMPTTSGSVLFEDTIPPEDAYIVKQIRDAGGIILAKANLGEISSGSLSSLGGQTRNPYNPARDTGGSSSGTGASIAANLGVIGIGTDTGGSVRHPSGFCSLVGLRPTTGLLSRTGIAPISETQDTAGPMTRTVTDAAIMMDVMAGYDPADELSARTRYNISDRFTSCLTRNGLRTARLGVPQQLFGPKTEKGHNPEREAEVVTEVITTALDDMASVGAELVKIDVMPDLEAKVSAASAGSYEFRREFNDYLDRLGDAAPIDSPKEIQESGTVEGYVRLEERLATDPETLDENLEYLQALDSRKHLQRLLLTTMEDRDLDAIVYPMASRIPSRTAEDRLYRTSSNAKMAAYSGFPAMTVPAGYDDEWGTPVGVEFLAGPFEEARLFELAYAYERLSERRIPPSDYTDI